jgi:hypothetical protein
LIGGTGAGCALSYACPSTSDQPTMSFTAADSAASKARETSPIFGRRRGHALLQQARGDDGVAAIGDELGDDLDHRARRRAARVVGFEGADVEQEFEVAADPAPAARDAV